MSSLESTPDVIWAYSQVIDLSEKLDPSFNRAKLKLSSVSSLQEQLRIIRQKLDDPSVEGSKFREQYEKVSRFIAENEKLFSQEIPKKSVLSRLIKAGIGIASLGLTSQETLRAAADKASEDLQTAQVDPAALASLHTITARLPQFLLELLKFYRDNPKYPPPGVIKSLFTQKQTERTGELSVSGIVVMHLLSEQGEWTSSFFQTNLLCLLNSIRQAFANPQNLPPTLFTGTAKERAKAITDFIFSNSQIVPPSGIFSVFSGLIKGLVQRQIQSLLSPSKEPPPTSSEPEQPLSPPPEKHPSPEIPSDLVHRFAEFQDLADALGSTFVDNIPEFALLRRRDEPPKLEAAHEEKPLPLLEAIGKIFSPTVTSLTRTEDIQRKIAEKRQTLVDQGFLSQKSVKYPRACCDAILKKIKEGLDDPKNALPALYPLIEGEPPRLNDRGLAVRALLNDANIENIACLVELNMLQMLDHAIKTIEAKQKGNPEFLLDTLLTIVDSMQQAIQKADSLEDTADKWDVPQNAQIVTETLLATIGDFALPDAFANKIHPETMLPEGVHRGARLLEKHFDTAVSGITTFILREALKRGARSSKQRSAAPGPAIIEAVPEQKAAEEESMAPQLEPPPDFEYSKKKELEQKIAGLFPGFRIVGKKLAEAASKLFPYGAITFHCFVDRALSVAPDPDKVAKELLTLPKAVLKKPGPKPEAAQPTEPKQAEKPKAKGKKPEPISPKTIIRDVLTTLKKKIENDFHDIRFMEHPFKSIKLACTWVGLALGVLIVPRVAPVVLGLQTHEKMIDYLHNVLRGGLHGGAQEDIPLHPPP